LEINALDIVNFRDKYGLSQTEFGKLIGASLRTVQNYENGSTIPLNKKAIIQSVINNYNPNTTYKEDLKAYNKELDVYKAQSINELKEIAYKYMANEDKLYKHNLLPDNREMQFWLRYKEIIDEYGSIDNYLNREI
jgi:transcriptional regulator with XRE-family HTH domain